MSDVVDLGYIPRAAFVPFHERRQRWACIVAHRRCGKTVACVMDLVDAALRSKQTDARFSYIAPTYSQGKDVAWSYLKRFTAAVPGIDQRESDLVVAFPNGARVRIFGADNYDRLRGGYNDGLVMDEYGDFDPRAWPEVIRPTLADRRGWATFIGTPKGRNSFWDIHQQARSDPDWFSLVLKASRTGLLPPEELADLRRALTPAQFQQELECSFEAAVVGAVYARELEAAEAEGRITRVPYDPKVGVNAYFDLGFADATAIWLTQTVRSEIRLIDFIQDTQLPITAYLKQLQMRPYVIDTLFLPHDAQAKQLGTGTSVEEIVRAAGFKVRIVEGLSVADGINATRVQFGNMWFDRDKCDEGLSALRRYRYDTKPDGSFSQQPRHDYASHSADALRYACVAMQEQRQATYSGRRPEPRLPTAPDRARGLGWMRQ